MPTGLARSIDSPSSSPSISASSPEVEEPRACSGAFKLLKDILLPGAVGARRRTRRKVRTRWVVGEDNGKGERGGDRHGEYGDGDGERELAMLRVFPEGPRAVFFLLTGDVPGDNVGDGDNGDNARFALGDWILVLVTVAALNTGAAQSAPPLLSFEALCVLLFVPP